MRRDLISLKFDELSLTLAKIAELKQQEQWEEIIKILGANLKQILKTNLKEVRNLTETGLLAQLVKGEPTFFVPYKRMMLIALLKETGDYAMKKGHPKAARAWYLEALHFLLDCLEHGEIIRQYSNLVPTVEVLLEKIGDSSLPVETHLLLMREYERRACFARAWGECQAALEGTPRSSNHLGFGIAFLERLIRESDATLVAEGLNRSEIKANLAELASRREQLCCPE